MLPLKSTIARRDGRGAALFLDFGTKCGWAVVHEDGTMRSGVFDYGKKPGRHPGEPFLRFWRMFITFAKQQESTVTKKTGPAIGLIGFEDVVFGVGKPRTRQNFGQEIQGSGQTQMAAQKFGAWRGIALAYAAAHDIPIMTAHPNTVKKFITGSGKATKDQVIFAVRQLGHDPVDDNEADAIALAYYGLAQEGMSPVPAEPPPEPEW